MQRTDPRNAPQRGAGAGKALAQPQNHPPHTEQRQACHRRVAQRRQQNTETADQAAHQPDHHDLLRSPEVGVTPGVGPAQQRRHILQADHHPRPEGAESQLVMYPSRQNRQRQTDSEIAGKVIGHNREDQQRETEVAGWGGRFHC